MKNDVILRVIRVLNIPPFHDGADLLRRKNLGFACISQSAQIFIYEADIGNRASVCDFACYSRVLQAFLASWENTPVTRPLKSSKTNNAQRRKNHNFVCAQKPLSVEVNQNEPKGIFCRRRVHRRQAPRE